MKILKHKKPPKIYRGECNCGCVVECNEKEVHTFFDQRDGNSYFVKCPECHNDHLWVTWVRFEKCAYEEMKKKLKGFYIAFNIKTQCHEVIAYYEN